jgi:hypothetical protein
MHNSSLVKLCHRFDVPGIELTVGCHNHKCVEMVWVAVGHTGTGGGRERETCGMLWDAECLVKACTSSCLHACCLPLICLVARPIWQMHMLWLLGILAQPCYSREAGSSGRFSEVQTCSNWSIKSATGPNLKLDSRFRFEEGPELWAGPRSSSARFRTRPRHHYMRLASEARPAP